MIYRLLSIVWLLCVVLAVGVNGQNTIANDKQTMEFRRGIELFNHGQYEASSKLFSDFLRDYGSVATQFQLADIAYYDAMGAVRTGAANAADVVMSFVDGFPVDTRINYARFCLAGYYMNQGKNGFKSALKMYKEVDERDLDKVDRDEYWFNLAMCYYKSGDYDLAQPIFLRLVNADNRYYSDALYYYSFIAYNDKNYSTALEGFLKLQDDERYGGEGLGYVLAHIYYEQKDLKRLAEVGEVLLKGRGEKKLPSATKANNALVERALGELYFRTGDFANVVKYMDMYAEDAKRTEKYDEWLLGYANYRLAKYDVALDHLQRVVSGKDSLDYNAQYHIGICYLKSGEKAFAQKAFYNAYQMAFDQSSQENALFNYAKLSYELSADPYKTAMSAMQEYLDAYPDSDRSDEAKGLMMQLLVMTKNYANAVAVLNTMKFKKVDFMMLEQKLCYYYGVELFNGGKYEQALAMFERASDMTFYADITSQSMYWEGECYYRLKKYGKAIEKFREFVNSSGSKKSPYYANGYYGMGYAYFKNKDYDNAVAGFKKMLGVQGVQSDRAMYYDAVLRLADCLQQTKNYSEAIGYYDKCYKADVADSDYALYQEALCYGALGKFANKAKLLRQFISSYDKSVYLSQVCYELGVTDLIENKETEALADFEKVVKQFPNSVYASRALLKQGLIYYNREDNQNALSKLKQIVSNYGGTPEATEALTIISNIYVEMNDINAFANYVKGVPNAKFGAKDRDSLLFISAEKRYLSGDCKGARDGLRSYLNGENNRFRVNASYYLGDCLFADREYDEALKMFEFVINSPQGIFSENAYAKAAFIDYERGEYDKALGYYEALEKLASNKSNVLQSEAGIMNSAYRAGNYDKAAQYARKLMMNDKITEQMLVDAHFIIARSAQMADNNKLALSEFKITRQLSKGEIGAEAGYEIAVILFKDKKYKEAETAAFDVINSYADYELWRAKCFVLLADIYMGMGNDFQAKETLQSVIDNCEIETIKAEATEKINNIGKK